MACPGLRAALHMVAQRAARRNLLKNTFPLVIHEEPNLPDELLTFLYQLISRGFQQLLGYLQENHGNPDRMTGRSSVRPAHPWEDAPHDARQTE